ncbi:hypothetical protein [Yeosuana aromativorans]|uniref:hypothetical protein n=1 Tax=Yeosuana aromativorans TaxID=288019 RepID=UPI00166DA0D8|nr:hypothetical protein [Yeosuana aromativorans]
MIDFLMTRQRRRHSTGFGYIGFGNNQSIFNQHSKKAFSELKDKLNEETHIHHQIHFSHKRLTKTEKEGIKNRIRKAEKRKSVKIMVVTIGLSLLLSFLCYKYIISPLF